MGQIVEFPTQTSPVEGYLVTAGSGTGPGLVVLPESWGLVDHIKDVCERFGAEGFSALAPDLYRGERPTQPDEAIRMVLAMDLGQTARDLAGAVDFLAASTAARGGQIGVVGFSMGGGLALWLGTLRPDAVAAVVPFYSVIPWAEAQPDWSRLKAAVQGHYAEKDVFATAAGVRGLESMLAGLGVEVAMFIYEGTRHAFFDDTRPGVYHPEAAEVAWARTVEFFHRRLG